MKMQIDGLSDSPESAYQRRSFLRKSLTVAPALAAASMALPSSASAAGTAGYYFNVRDYGAIGNGTADDTSSIQAAISAALTAGGGCVLLPAGKYLVGGTLSIDATSTTTSVVLQGVNPAPVISGSAWQGGTTILVPATYAGDTISATNSDRLAIKNIAISSSAPRTAGRAIYLNYTINALIEDVDMNNQFVGIEIFGGYGHRINRGAWNIAANGIGLWMRGTQSGNNGLDNSNDTYINLISANGGWATFRIQNTGGTWMSQCDSITASYGLLIDPAADQAVMWCFFESCAFDSSSASNMRIEPAGGKVRGLNFVDCWSATLTQSGGGANCCTIGGDVDGVQFVGHRFLNSPSAHGLWVYQSKNIFVDACVATGFPNGGGFVFLSVIGFAVRNCQSGAYAGQPGNTYGVYIDSACSHYLVTGCSLVGNGTGIVDSGVAPKVVPSGMNLVA